MTPSRAWLWIGLLAAVSVCDALESPIRIYDLSFMPFGEGGFRHVNMDITSKVWQFQAAVKLACDDVNANPSILPNHTLVPVHQDDYFTVDGVAERASSALDPLHNPVPYRVMMGPLSNELAQAACQVTRRFHVPLVADRATSPTLGDKTLYPTFSRVSSGDSIEGEALAYMVQSFGWQQLATIGTSEETPVFLINAFTDKAGTLNISIPIAVSVDESADLYGEDKAQFSQRLDDISKAGVRVILLACDVLMALPILQIAKEKNMLQQPYVWIGTSGWLADSSESPVLTAMLDGFLGTLTPTDRHSPKYREMAASWTAAYKRDNVSMFYAAEYSLAATRYDSVHVIAKALDAYVRQEQECALPGNANLVLQENLSPPEIAYRTPGFGGNVPPYHLELLRLNYNFSGGCTETEVLSAMHQIYYLFEEPSLRGRCCLAQQRHTQGVLLTWLIRQQTYDGASGFISFLPNGDRTAELALVNVKGTTITVFAKYNVTADNEAVITAVAGANGIVRFIGGGHNVPSDRPTVEQRILYPDHGVRIAMFFLTCVGYVVCGLAIALNVKYREHAVIKMSSPILNVQLVCGCCIALTFGILNDLDSEFVPLATYQAACTVKPWVLVLGFTMTFGTLFSKTGRVHRIFNAKKMSVQKITDGKLMRRVGVLLLVDVVLLSLWSALEPVERTLHERSRASIYRDGIEFTQVTYNEQCEPSGDGIFMQILIVEKCCLLALGSYLAYQVRNVKYKAMNDAKWIGMAIYNLIILIAVIAPASALVTDASAGLALVSGGVVLCVISLLLLLFLPKYSWIRSGEQVQTKTSDSDPSANHSAQVAALEAEVARLKQQVQRLQHAAASGVPGAVVRGSGAGAGAGGSARPSISVARHSGAGAGGPGPGAVARGDSHGPVVGAGAGAGAGVGGLHPSPGLRPKNGKTTSLASDSPGVDKTILPGSIPDSTLSLPAAASPAERSVGSHGHSHGSLLSPPSPREHDQVAVAVSQVSLQSASAHQPAAAAALAAVAEVAASEQKALPSGSASVGIELTNVSDVA